MGWAENGAPKCGTLEEEESKKCVDLEDEWVPRQRKSTLPDGGWGWLVAIASFCCNVVVDGVCFSFGVIAPEYVETFGPASEEMVGWVGSTLAGSYLLVGPFVSALCSRYGCRKMTMIGSVVAMSGFALSTQATSIELLIVTYGLVGGIGFGMIYLPSIVCVGCWFDKRRAFVTGLAVCGSGVGQFIFPPLSQYLLREYTWEGKNLILAGIILNCAVCGALFRPLDRWHNKPRKPVVNKAEIERGAIMKALIEEKKRQRTISNGSLDNCIITRDNRLIKLDPALFEGRRNNSFIARFKRQLGFSSQSLATSKTSLQAIPSIVIDAVQKDLKAGGSSPIYKPNGTRVQQLSHSHLLQKRSSSPDSTTLPMNGCSIPMLTNGLPSTRLANGGPGVMPNGMPKTRSCDELPNKPWLRMSPENGVEISGQLSFQQMGGSSGGMSTVSRSASDLPTSPTPSVEGSVISIQVIPNGALCRNNSSHSLRLRSSRSVSSDCSSRHQPLFIPNSAVSIPQYNASIEEMELEIERQDCMLLKLWRILRDMFALYLLADAVYFLLVFSTFVTLLVFYIPYFFLPRKGISMNMTREASSYLISIIGITNTIGRLMAGWLADRPWINTLYLNNFSLLMAGTAILAVPWSSTPAMLAVIAAIFGFCFAVFISLRSVLLVELLGLDMLTKSFGMLILFQGIAAFIGLPLAGALNKLTGSVDSCFYMAGALTIFSGLLMFPVQCLRKPVQSQIALPSPEEIPFREKFPESNCKLESTMLANQ